MFLKHNLKTPKNTMIFRSCFKKKKISNYYSGLKKYVFLQNIMLVKHNVYKA